MKVHEYQAREVLLSAGVKMPQAVLARSGDEAAAAFTQLGGAVAVVKAQVHAGGRGKGGGVKLVKSADEAKREADRILSKPLVTHQTGPEGVPVRSVLVAAGVEIAKEYYVGVVLDRARGVPVMMASAEGGVEIEEVARTKPGAIHKEAFHPMLGLQPYSARKLAAAIGLTKKPAAAAAKLMLALGRVFLEKDCSLAEINPLVLTKSGEVTAIDAKINFDDNAVPRHADVEALYDPTEEDAAEIRARDAGLSYIALDGNIGCLVNGAGLAMATMDIIKLHGGEPANFLDVGGSVTADGAKEAFGIILSDPKVKAILVNIFGGIAKCDLIAEALIAAGREIGFKVPVVVRLEGTNVERARKLLEGAKGDLPTLITASDLTDAAQKVVKATK
ncbi:MAG: Succinate--CoA ligase [ADP-forming] subunit beta [Phycisphaerae bacterium]|nr:Succinate--CoA ligase [ADP-forming] subunit beta [Phycisphaerae bacterium]